MPLTPFGKAARRIRIERDMLLKDLADRLEVTATFLSAVESGRKPLPRNFAERIATALGLSPADKKELQHAADLSTYSVQIPLGPQSSAYDRSLASMLARNFDALGETEKDAIRNILNRHSEGE